MSDDPLERLIERLWRLHHRGLSYATDKPAVNLLLADMAEGCREAAIELRVKART